VASDRTLIMAVVVWMSRRRTKSKLHSQEWPRRIGTRQRFDLGTTLSFATVLIQRMTEFVDATANRGETDS
jgi:hypothetical protein